MNTDFEKDYSEFQAIMEQSKDTIPAAAQAFVERFGTCRTKVLLFYSQSIECGKPYLDIIGNICPETVHDLVTTFRIYGITEFTLSSTEPFTAQAAWWFIEEGCNLSGMVMLDYNGEGSRIADFEKKPAFFFTLDPTL